MSSSMADSISLYGFVEATLCITSFVQGYVVHHRPVLCTMVHKGDHNVACTD